ncbi:MAG: hypothetical protein CMJ58_25520 [Planctomycetaceae bacterium]|nr:hypothetical protein [Planctomycetaceae bacterium]
MIMEMLKKAAAGWACGLALAAVQADASLADHLDSISARGGYVDGLRTEDEVNRDKPYVAPPLLADGLTTELAGFDPDEPSGAETVDEPVMVGGGYLAAIAFGDDDEMEPIIPPTPVTGSWLADNDAAPSDPPPSPPTRIAGGYLAVVLFGDEDDELEPIIPPTPVTGSWLAEDDASDSGDDDTATRPTDVTGGYVAMISFDDEETEPVIPPTPVSGSWLA